VLVLGDGCVVVIVESVAIFVVTEVNVELEVGRLVLVVVAVVGVSVDTVVGSNLVVLVVVCSVQIHS
jgi:hypothetical protein